MGAGKTPRALTAESLTMFTRASDRRSNAAENRPERSLRPMLLATVYDGRTGAARGEVHLTSD